MKPLFITGTGTEVGKTVISSLLCAGLEKRGESVLVQKWVSTGDPSPLSNDLLSCLKALKGKFPFDRIPGRKERKEAEKHYGVLLKSMNPYSFPYPASPHLAAELDKRRISSDVIRKAVSELMSRKDVQRLIIEGAGGVMVPFTRSVFLADLLQEYRFPTVLVSANRLGTINETLLSINELKRRKIPVKAVILNSVIKEKLKIREDNIKILSCFLADIPVISCPPVKNPASFLRTAVHLTEQLIEKTEMLY